MHIDVYNIVLRNAEHKNTCQLPVPVGIDRQDDGFGPAPDDLMSTSSTPLGSPLIPPTAV